MTALVWAQRVEVDLDARSPAAGSDAQADAHPGDPRIPGGYNGGTRRRAAGNGEPLICDGIELH